MKRWQSRWEGRRVEPSAPADSHTAPAVRWATCVSTALAVWAEHACLH